MSGALLPTAEPYLYTVSVTATTGTSLSAVESTLLEELDRVRREGITAEELARAKTQLDARLVFDDDSVTNIAHQLGYFETIASVDLFLQLRSRIRAVTLEEVAQASAEALMASNRCIGWFDPLPVPSSPTVSGTKA